MKEVKVGGLEEVYIKDFSSKTGKPHLDPKGFDNKMFAMKDGIKFDLLIV